MLSSDGRPTSGTANDDVALQHASRTRSPLLRKGKIGDLRSISPRLYSACYGQGSSDHDYVGQLEQIASRRRLRREWWAYSDNLPGLHKRKLVKASRPCT